MAETETETILCPELLFPLSSHPELLAPSPQVFSLRERRDEFRMATLQHLCDLNAHFTRFL